MSCKCVRPGLLLCLVLCALLGAAAGPGAAADGDRPEESKRSGFVFIPIIFYSPETNVGAGASVIHYFRRADGDSAGRPSTIQPTFIYTQKTQIVSAIGTDLYWHHDVNRLIGSIGYVKFPNNFYGIGQETTDSMGESYTPETVSIDVGYYRRLYSPIRFGLRYEFRHASMLETEEGGLLEPGTIPGSKGGGVSGIGFSIDWDTRDNVFHPFGGSYHYFTAAFFDDRIGSDFAFNRYIVDLRKYISLGASSVLAFQGLGHFSTGHPPFQMLAQIGGQSRARGYYGGRYRDRHALVAQAEFRRRLARWWGIVLFAGGANVAPELDAFGLDKAKPFIGYGVRYVFNKEEEINISLDMGFGEDSSGFYITIGEAF